MIKPLKLRADSAKDVEVFSAVLQDAITQVGSIRYDTQARSLTLRMTRYRHEAQLASERVLTGLRIDGVLDLKSKGIDRTDPEAMAVLLSVTFKPSETEPAGDLHLVFAGGGEIRIEAECIDMTLADVSDPRKTDKQPLHPVD